MTARPLSVMIDARMLIGRFSGVARVVTSLVDELAKDDGLAVAVLCGQRPIPSWEKRTDIRVVTSSFGPGDRSAVRRLIWEETNLRKLIRRARVDLFHATWNSGVPAYCPVPCVLTIHDLIPWNDPEPYFANLAQRFCYQLAVSSSVRRAALVTTVSEYIRQQVLTTLRLDPAKVVTVPNGVSVPELKTREPDRQAEPYVLYVGGYEPRKNVAAVFAAMRSYWRRYDSSIELRLTGERDSLDTEAAKAYHQNRPDAPIRFLGHVDDAGLARQYASASALLMLSRDEGFGLPVLEAMAYGCPVVAANKAALPEVVGDAGILVDPDRADEVADAIRDILVNPSRRTDIQRRAAARARAFGWHITASRMRDVYGLALHLGKRKRLVQQAAGLYGDERCDDRPLPRSSDIGHPSTPQPLVARCPSRTYDSAG